jgi:hypothetical protein
MKYCSPQTQLAFCLMMTMPLDKLLSLLWQISFLLPDFIPKPLGPSHILIVSNKREEENQGH